MRHVMTKEYRPMTKEFHPMTKELHPMTKDKKQKDAPEVDPAVWGQNASAILSAVVRAADAVKRVRGAAVPTITPKLEAIMHTTPYVAPDCETDVSSMSDDALAENRERVVAERANRSTWDTTHIKAENARRGAERVADAVATLRDAELMDAVARYFSAVADAAEKSADLRRAELDRLGARLDAIDAELERRDPRSLAEVSREVDALKAALARSSDM